MIPFFSELDRRLFIGVATALGALAAGWLWSRPEPPAASANVEPTTEAVSVVAADQVPPPEEAAEEHDGISIVEADAGLTLSTLLEIQRARRPVAQNDYELRGQLIKVPIVGLEVPPVEGKRGHGPLPLPVPRRPWWWGSLHGADLAAMIPSATGLPFRSASDCRISREEASELRDVSRNMRAALAAAAPVEDPELRALLVKTAIRRSSVETKLEHGFNCPEVAVPGLVQMLCSGDRVLSCALVDVLGRIQSKSATQALARLALFDPSKETRDLALEHLGKRPAEDFRQVLLGGLRYPWPPVADHAATALVRLGDEQAVPALIRLLQEGAPHTSLSVGGERHIVRELVRINHLCNCNLCHAGSVDAKDPVRGRVPEPNLSLPPLTEYYQDTFGIFVRADITYLKQDFSVMLPVANPEPWPKLQRYDFMVRTRAATPEEVEGHRDRPADVSYPQRAAVLWALKELTGTPKGP
jgi:hypothetical protein